MAVYFITGKLGCGKTLCTVGKIRDYLTQGRRVATNLDIYPEAFTKKDSMVTVLRIPDKPSLADLDAIGVGCEEPNESKYGLLVLDELGTWFNSRNWRDKGRLEVINWFLHARKLHWDIYLIVQNMNSLDDQLVSALCEHLVVCKRTDRLSIPIIGPILKMFGIQKVFPKIHVAKVYYGQTTSSMAVDRWWYRGRDLYAAYNTDQIFDEESHALHSPLPAYYRNNVKLIAKYRQKITSLSPDSKTGQPPDGRFLKLAAMLLVFFMVMLVSYRTYAKLTAFTNEKKAPVHENKKLVQVIDPISKLPLLAVTGRSVAVPLVYDAIRLLTESARITVSSSFVYEGKVNAVLHITKGKYDENIITLDDARAIGYIVVINGKFVKVTKADYSFSFALPG